MEFVVGRKEVIEKVITKKVTVYITKKGVVGFFGCCCLLLGFFGLFVCLLG